MYDTPGIEFLVICFVLFLIWHPEWNIDLITRFQFEGTVVRAICVSFIIVNTAIPAWTLLS